VQLIFVLYEVIWFIFFAFVIGFSVKRLGIKHSVSFFLPAVVWGILLEYATQEVFCRYNYGKGFLVYVANVPLNISLAWAALMYISYWFASRKLQLKNSVGIAVAASLPLLLLDVFLLEPTAKIFGFWVWTPQSVWFGSPIGNIYGWFWVIVLFLSFYHFLDQKIRDWRKILSLNLVLIVLRVLVLVGLLQIWKIVFGGL
jgi:uncharacterized membrane protein